MCAEPPKADIADLPEKCTFLASSLCPLCPQSGHSQTTVRCPLYAITGREQMRQTNVRGGGYSITSSARSGNAGGSVRPSILAVLRLITRSISVGNSIGKSSAAAPFRILSTRRLWPQVRTLQRSGRIDAQVPTTKVLRVEREFRHSAGTAPRALWAGAPLPARSDAIASNTPSRRTSA